MYKQHTTRRYLCKPSAPKMKLRGIAKLQGLFIICVYSLQILTMFDAYSLYVCIQLSLNMYSVVYNNALKCRVLHYSISYHNIAIYMYI